MKRLLICLLLLPAGCPDSECEPGWQPLFEDLPAPVLSVSGTADETWMVGGGLGVSGVDALAMRNDDGGWQTLATDRTETLWWVWPEPAGDRVWMVGEAGLVLRWSRSTGELETVPSGTDATLYGVWGSGPDDVWMVGGTVGTGGAKDVILHWDGTAITAAATRPELGAVLFKVWGSAGNDVWVVGEAGVVLHYDGSSWSDASQPVADALLTVHGCAADDVYAVGGRALLHYDGTAWTEVTGVTPGSFVNGVHCGPDRVLVVGNAGTKLTYDRPTDSWADSQFEAPWDTDFHGAWISPDGEQYAVGGNFLTPPGAGNRVGVVGRSCP